MIAFLNRHRRLLMIVGFASLALGAVSAFYLPDLQWRADALAKAPQTITLKDLAANGPGDNRTSSSRTSPAATTLCTRAEREKTRRRRSPTT